jgi:NAD(P)-dependent dehydrogenase (short-subunit alcohol dehydrogenase family)
MGWLDGDVVAITGAGSGIGRALVDRFISEGARVGVLEINPEKAQALRDHFGDSVVVVEGDATRFADNERAVTATAGAFGKLDTFVANAGLWDYRMSLDALPADAIDGAFDEVFGLNVKACLLGAKASVDALRASRGSMIFTVSNAGFWPGGGGPLYTASKHAVMGLVKQLAYELAPEIRVNGVAPGGMATDLRGPRALGLQDVALGVVVPNLPEMLAKGGTLEIALQPEDYTGTYVLLASRTNSRSTTGSVHNCDGGMGVAGRREMEAMMAGQ